MQQTLTTSFLALAAVTLFAARATAQPTVDFDGNVRPLLEARCGECHGGETREGGLRFQSRQDVLNRNDSGEPAIVPGESDKSTLISRITAQGDRRMPPEGDPLTADEIALLKRWIDQGAAWPEVQTERHWSYIAPVRPSVPARAGEWGRNAIDAFVHQRLIAENLSPSAEAEPARLLRRVYLDLIGIPPTVDEVEQFLADPSEEHYQQIVDRLLDSPRYGEKWARQWLDLARYADSNGFQADQFREIWAYRDWVIQAMNDDMPFDQFTIEQVAGDLLPDATLSQRIATGFHRCTTCNVEAGVDPEENRVNQIIDRVNTTGLVWLGTSLECAQCHNHKYDPFTQQDYYQIFAFFNNTPLEVSQITDEEGVSFDVSGPKLDLPLPGNLKERRQQLETDLAAVELRIQARKQELEAGRAAWEEMLRNRESQLSEWSPLTVTEFKSTGGAEHKLLDDGSVLVTGTAPVKDTYEVMFSTDLKEIRGFKLEALTHESLSGGGPGRSSDARPNFVLYEFELQATAVGSPEFEPVKLRNATADFSQNNWDVSGLIDGKPKTGWAISPQFGKPHWATFETVEPIGGEGGTSFRLTLPQTFGGARTLGRFRVSATTGSPSTPTLTQELQAALLKDAGERTKGQASMLVKLQEQSDSPLNELEQQLKSLKDELEKIGIDSTLVMVEMPEQRMTSIFKRGNFLDPLAQVEPAVPAALHPLLRAGEKRENRERLNRTHFARWLVSRENPLVARVAVNRWWGEFFGRGLVETQEDFGTQGERPTHPELLDWLAVEFMESSWSMKHVHRLIALSATYRQDSRMTPASLQRDPYNKLYARGPRLRLSAEAIRDNALAASGLLSTKMGGPPIYPPQPENIWRHVGRNAPKYDTDTDEDRYRRGVYVVWRRSAPYPSFVNFDAPDRGSCVVNRSRTNTPLQALTLLNDPAYVEMAHALAGRMAAAGFQGERERIEFGFRCCVSRLPTSDEATLLLEFFEQEKARHESAPMQAEALVPEKLRRPDVPTPVLAAWFEVANVLLNLDECITKN